MWYNFRQNVIILDCEMSGLDPDTNQLIEVAAIKCDPKNLAVISSFHTLVGPIEGSSIDNVIDNANPRALLKTNLQKQRQAIAAAPPPSQVISSLIDWLPKDYLLVGYSVMLDLLFINAELNRTASMKKLSYKIIDVASLVELYKATKPGIITDWSLHGACGGLNVPCFDAHNAMADCETTRQLLIKLLQLFDIT